MKKISIDPITRLEGHGKIEIFLNDDGDVENVYFQVPELRGFETFCRGRLAEDMPVLTSRICGICPEAHHLASVKALDEIYGAEPPPAVRKIRELLYTAFFINDHTTHFYVLGGPDLIVGPDAPPEKRNFMGVIGKLGADAGKSIVACRSRNHKVIEILGGRSINLVAGVPGGWSKPVSPHEAEFIRHAAEENLSFALFTLRLFHDSVLRSPHFEEMFRSDLMYQETSSLGMVDDRNRSNFYDGKLRVISPDGGEIAKFSPRDYAVHIAEHVEPWTYLKFPYLLSRGRNGPTGIQDGGIYSATPLSRMNVSDCLNGPLAQEEFERLFDYFGSKKETGRYRPVHHRLATHWARLVEILDAAERMAVLSCDEEILSPDVRRPLDGVKCRTGVGCVEAPRGTLIHHYTVDDRGVIERVNIISGTTHNNAPISISIKKAAQSLIRKGTIVTEGLLNRIEMAFRLYDPCLSCATHAIGEQSSLRVTIRDSSGSVIMVPVK